MNKFLLALTLVAIQLQAAPLSVIKNSDLPTVTAGIPLAACALTDIAKFKLVNAAGQEVATFVKPLMYWPESKCSGVKSIRAIKLQWAFSGAQVYQWSLSGSTLPHLTEQPIGEVVSVNPLKAGAHEPAHFAINDPAYLVTTGIIPPTTIAGNNNHDKVWYPAAFAKHVAATNFAKNEAMEWLFDPVSSLYQQALRTGSVEQYREAYLEHEFWISKMNLAGMGIPNWEDKCIGGFNMDYEPGRSVAKDYQISGLGCDEKWTYLNPWKLHLALTGDDSWTPQEIGGRISPVGDTREKLINEIGTRAFSNGWARTSALDAPYTDVAEVFTERGAGFAIQRQVAAYELTLNPVLLQNLSTSITNLHLMMTNNPDGLGNHGYMSHSWGKHEGWYPAYIGVAEVVPNASISQVTVGQLVLEDYKLIQAGTSLWIVGTDTGVLYKEDVATRPAVLNSDGTVTIALSSFFAPPANRLTVSFSDHDPAMYKSAADRVFSPWMQSILADGLWQAYQIIDDAAAKAKIEEMLLGFGHSITAYAMDGQFMNPVTKQLIESAFNVQLTTRDGWWGGKGGPFPRYVSSYLTSTGTSQALEIALNSGSGPYADQHSPEMLCQISLALKFETDPAKKAAMSALANDFLFWFESADRAPEFPPRGYGWTEKCNPWGTYSAVTGITTSPPIATQPPVVVTPPGGTTPVAGTPVSGNVWFSDELPAGAVIGLQANALDWGWVTTSVPIGTRAFTVPTSAGAHQNYFTNATIYLPLTAGDTIGTYVYLDATDMPSEVMLQFLDSTGDWEHRAYWGNNDIGWGGDESVGHHYVGALPESGKWVKLEVPASAVGLDGRNVVGMLFTLYNGSALFNAAGKNLPAVTPPVVVPPGPYVCAAGYYNFDQGTTITSCKVVVVPPPVVSKTEAQVMSESLTATQALVLAEWTKYKNSTSQSDALDAAAIAAKIDRSVKYVTDRLVKTGSARTAITRDAAPELLYGMGKVISQTVAGAQ